jgi:hypothetical protein
LIDFGVRDLRHIVERQMMDAKRVGVVSQPVEMRDGLPTFLEAAGAELSRPIDGRSLLSLVRKNGEGWRSIST